MGTGTPTCCSQPWEHICLAPAAQGSARVLVPSVQMHCPAAGRSSRDRLEEVAAAAAMTVVPKQWLFHRVRKAKHYLALRKAPCFQTSVRVLQTPVKVKCHHGHGLWDPAKYAAAVIRMHRVRQLKQLPKV